MNMKNMNKNRSNKSGTRKKPHIMSNATDKSVHSIGTSSSFTPPSSSGSTPVSSTLTNGARAPRLQVFLCIGV